MFPHGKLMFLALKHMFPDEKLVFPVGKQHFLGCKETSIIRFRQINQPKSIKNGFEFQSKQICNIKNSAIFLGSLMKSSYICSEIQNFNVMNEDMMNLGNAGMTVNESMKTDLLSAAKWTKFLCIMGCIGVGLMVLLAIAMIVFGSAAANLSPAFPVGGLVGIIYLICAAVYIYPLIKGFQFANATKAACLFNNDSELARGFSGLSSLCRYLGILTIVIMAIYILVIIGIVFATIFRALGTV